MASSIRLRCLLAGLLLGLPWAAGLAAGPGVALVTILEGDAVVLHGASRFAAAVGEAVEPEDIVESGKAAFVRIEFEDGTRIDLGPSTRLQLAHPSAQRGDRPALYMLSGWLKVSPVDSKAPSPAGVSSPLVDGLGLAGSTVLHVDGSGGDLFAEQGRVRCQFRFDHAPITLASGDFLTFVRGGRVASDARPSPAFVSRLPAQFRDSIPPLYARYKGRKVAPRELDAFSYAEVEGWLQGEASIRHQFVTTWRARADEPDFRQALMEHINQHPEWGPLLFPDLFPARPVPATSN